MNKYKIIREINAEGVCSYIVYERLFSTNLIAWIVYFPLVVFLHFYFWEKIKVFQDYNSARNFILNQEYKEFTKIVNFKYPFKVEEHKKTFKISRKKIN